MLFLRGRFPFASLMKLFSMSARWFMAVSRERTTPRTFSQAMVDAVSSGYHRFKIFASQIPSKKK